MMPSWIPATVITVSDNSVRSGRLGTESRAVEYSESAA